MGIKNHTPKALTQMSDAPNYMGAIISEPPRRGRRSVEQAARPDTGLTGKNTLE